MAIETTAVGATATTVYTSTNNSAVTFASFTNYTGTAATISVYVVPNGDTAGNGNVVIDTLTVNGNDTHQLYLGGEKLLLENGDTLQATASAGTTFTAVVSYASI
jgi:hypothetical protein